MADTEMSATPAPTITNAASSTPTQPPATTADTPPTNTSTAQPETAATNSQADTTADAAPTNSKSATNSVKSTSPAPPPIVSLYDAAASLAATTSSQQSQPMSTSVTPTKQSNTATATTTAAAAATSSTPATTSAGGFTAPTQPMFVPQPVYYHSPHMPSPQRYTLRQPMPHSTSNNSLNSQQSTTSSSANKLSALGTAAKQIDDMIVRPVLYTAQPIIEPVLEVIAADTNGDMNVDAGSSVVVLDEVIRQEVVRCVCGRVHIDPINTALVEAASTDPSSNLADPNQPVTNDNVSDAVVQCEGCLIWQHARCVGLTSLDSIPTEYYCDLCQPDSAIHQTRIKYEQMMSKLTPSKSSSLASVKMTQSTDKSPLKQTATKRQSYDMQTDEQSDAVKTKQAKPEPTDGQSKPAEVAAASNADATAGKT